MASKTLPLILTVGSLALYHLAQRFAPRGLHPLWLLFAGYLVGACSCLALLSFFPGTPGAATMRSYIHPSVLALGISIVGIELGFLLAYRVGWSMGSTGIVANAFATVLLLGVGFLFFHETLSWNKLMGLAACIGGLVLLTR